MVRVRVIAVRILDAQTNFDYLGEMNATSAIKHLLFYLEVDDPVESFRRSRLMFGTNHILQLVIQSLARKVQQNIGQVLDGLNSCMPGSLKGLVLEPWALKLLSTSDARFTVA